VVSFERKHYSSKDKGAPLSGPVSERGRYSPFGAAMFEITAGFSAHNCWLPRRSRAHRACGNREASTRRMSKHSGYDSSALLAPLSITLTCLAVTLAIFWWWSRRSAGRGSRGTKYVQREDGQIVRRSTRLVLQPPSLCTGQTHNTAVSGHCARTSMRPSCCVCRRLPPREACAYREYARDA